MLTYSIPLTTTGATLTSIDADILNTHQSNVHIWSSVAVQFSSQVADCDYVVLSANQVLAMPNLASLNNLLFKTSTGVGNLNIVVYND
jgi:hypothetical protein